MRSPPERVLTCGVAGGQPHGVHGDLDAAVEVPPLGRFDRVLNPGLLLEQGVHLVGVGPFGESRVDLVEAVRWARIGATAISTLPRTSSVGSSIGS